MTKEEAYNAMQQGLLLSHTSFGSEQYIYMDSNYIMKDESGNEYEESWDMDLEMYRTGWFVFKGKSKPKKVLGITIKEEKPVNYISHINGHPCPGKAMCLEYAEYSETACIFCDVNSQLLSVNKPTTELIEGEQVVQIALNEDNQATVTATQVQQQIVSDNNSDNGFIKEEKIISNPIILLAIIIMIIISLIIGIVIWRII